MQPHHARDAGLKISRQDLFGPKDGKVAESCDRGKDKRQEQLTRDVVVETQTFSAK